MYDIIKVLWGRSHGIRTAELVETLIAIRRELPEPKRVSETLQSCLNRYTKQSSAFRNRGEAPEEDLFYSPGDKGSGTWAVRHQVAGPWLEKRGVRPRWSGLQRAHMSSQHGRPDSARLVEVKAAGHQ